MVQRQDIEKLLQDGNTIQIKPQGYSMYPVLVPGRDEAVIEPIGDRKLRRGDVVLYRRDPQVTGGILVLHRIWKCKQDGYYMVGDNQKEIEGPLRAGQIKGIMVGLVRKGKYISAKNVFYCIATRGWLLLRPVRPGISKFFAGIKRSIKNRFD